MESQAVLNHYQLSLPQGWPMPVFSLGQWVKFSEVYGCHHTHGWGQIIGFAYRSGEEEGWTYDVEVHYDSARLYQYSEAQPFVAQDLTLIPGPLALAA